MQKRIVMLVGLSQQIDLLDLQEKVLWIKLAGFSVGFNCLGQVAKAGKDFGKPGHVGRGFQFSCRDPSPFGQGFFFPFQRVIVFTKILAVLCLIGSQLDRLAIQFERFVGHVGQSEQFADLRRDQGIFGFCGRQPAPDTRGKFLSLGFFLFRIFEDQAPPFPQGIRIVRLVSIELLILGNRFRILLLVNQLID